MALIIVSYEYLWFTTVVRWTPTFRDTAIPVILGVGEIVPPLLLENQFAWWVAFAILAGIGAGAFFNTITRLSVAMFPGHRTSYNRIFRLLRDLTMLSVATSVVSALVATAARLYPDQARVISLIAAGLLVLLVAVGIIGYSELALNRVYDEYQLSRRPPAFERLRRFQPRFRSVSTQVDDSVS